MGTVVAMTYQPILETARTFTNSAQVLRMVAKACKLVANALKMSFFGGIIYAWEIRRLELIAKKAENLAKIYDEFAGDLQRAVNDHKTGDYKAGSYFGEGVRG